jgi:hypothetical protein
LEQVLHRLVLCLICLAFLPLVSCSLLSFALLLLVLPCFAFSFFLFLAKLLFCQCHALIILALIYWRVIRFEEKLKERIWCYVFVSYFFSRESRKYFFLIFICLHVFECFFILVFSFHFSVFFHFVLLHFTLIRNGGLCGRKFPNGCVAFK